MCVESGKAKPGRDRDSNDNERRLHNQQRTAIMRRQRLRLQNWDRNSRQSHAHTANDSRHKHLPVLKRRRLNRSTDNDNHVREDDRSLPPNPLAKHKRHDRTERAPDIVDCRDEACHGRIRAAERVFEAFTAEDATKETLIIYSALASTPPIFNRERERKKERRIENPQPNNKKSSPEVMRIMAIRALPLNSRNFMMNLVALPHSK